MTARSPLFGDPLVPLTDPETGETGRVWGFVGAPDFGLDVSSFLGGGLSPEVAEHVEQSIAAALSAAAGEPVDVSGARLDGTKVHVNARMSRGLAEKLGLAPSLPTFLEDFEALRAARPLLAASAVELTEERLHIICPASVTFDAAEALRLELVAGAPAGVTVDVEIAQGGMGSAEDQAGRRLFGELRRERLGTPGIPGHCATLSVCASSGDAIHPPAWRERGE